MKLTEEEQKICDHYSERDEQGIVHCSECPLVIDKHECICKAICTEEEWAERKENDR